MLEPLKSGWSTPTWPESDASRINDMKGRNTERWAGYWRGKTSESENPRVLPV
jgi:hypothetical protein